MRESEREMQWDESSLPVTGGSSHFIAHPRDTWLDYKWLSQSQLLHTATGLMFPLARGHPISDAPAEVRLLCLDSPAQPTPGCPPCKWTAKTYFTLCHPTDTAQSGIRGFRGNEYPGIELPCVQSVKGPLVSLWGQEKMRVKLKSELKIKVLRHGSARARLFWKNLEMNDYTGFNCQPLSLF